MISKTFLSKRPAPKTPWYAGSTWYKGRHVSPADEYQARQRGLTIEEYLRRDDVIRQMATESGFYVGQTVYPVKPPAYQKYGAVRITGVCRKYADLEKDHKWPDDETGLMLITFQSISSPKDVMFCTCPYLSAKNEHLQIIQEC